MKKIIRNNFIDFSTVSAIETTYVPFTEIGLTDLMFGEHNKKRERLLLKSVLGAPDIKIDEKSIEDLSDLNVITYTKQQALKDEENFKHLLSSDKYYRTASKTDQILHFIEISSVYNRWDKEKNEIIKYWGESESILKGVNQF